MRVAIAIQGHGLDAIVEPRFGRASRFLVVEPGRGAEVLYNEAGATARGSAGVDAGDLVVAAGADAAIAGHVGPKAFGVLSTAHVAIHQVDNGVTGREALAAFLRGELPALDAPTIRGPWA